MSTDAAAISPDTTELTELEQFEQFVTATLLRGGRHTPLDEVVAEYRTLRRQVANLHSKLAVALAEVERGEARPLDVEALKARIRAELAAKGIVDE